MNTTLCPQPCMERQGPKGLKSIEIDGVIPCHGQVQALLCANLPFWPPISHEGSLIWSVCPAETFRIARDRHRSMIFICPRLGYIAIIAYNCNIPGTSLSRSFACTLPYNRHLTVSSCQVTSQEHWCSSHRWRFHDCFLTESDGVSD